MSPKSTSYMKMTLRFEGRCRHCRRKLPAGTVAYGQSEKFSGKPGWQFVCGRPSCMRKHGYELTYEVSMEAVRAAQRAHGGTPDE